MEIIKNLSIVFFCVYVFYLIFLNYIKIIMRIENKNNDYIDFQKEEKEINK